VIGRIIQKTTLKKMWHGNNALGRGIRHLFWSFVRFILSGWLWSIAVRLAAMSEPYKNVGVAFAFTGLGFFFWGLWGLRLALCDFGLRGILNILGASFILILTFNLLTFPEPIPLQYRFLPSLVKSMQQVWNQIYPVGVALAKAPEDFRFAYTGTNASDYLPGFPTPNPKDEQVVVEALPGQPNLSSSLKVGGYAHVTESDGERIDCRLGPGLTFNLSIAFSKNDRLLILDGPKNNTEEGSSWWKLHGPKGEGWCREEFLLPSQ